MAKMEWQEKINLDKLDENTRDYLLALLLENRELKVTAEKEHESWLFWFKRCEELEDAANGIGKKVFDYKELFPNEYQKGEN